MASTSTNKQPLLIDRVFNEAIVTDGKTSGNTGIDIDGANSAALLVNCTTNDGGLVEDIYAISRGTSAKTVLFFLSPAADYLRNTEAVFIGSITSGTTAGDYKNIASLPRVLAPVPHVGVVAPLATADAANPQQTPLKNQALYIPTGKALWVAVQGTTGTNLTGCPVVGAQGGFF